MRLFIAVPVPAAARRALLDAQEALKNQGAQGRFVSGENFHITLKFLGETEDLAGITRAMSAAVSDVRPFSLRLGDYGAFPGGKGQTGHVTVEDLTGELNRLYTLLESALADEGFPAGRKKYLPHVTLARSLEGVTEAPAIRREKFWGEGLVLYESVFTKHGVTYNMLHREVF